MTKALFLSETERASSHVVLEGKKNPRLRLPREVFVPPAPAVAAADDLEQIEELGRGAYGVVDKMRHVPSGVIMAVKVTWHELFAGVERFKIAMNAASP
ncbi:hypothetical protein CRUP_002180 [Coryphaenoides rupestris]|nr:hypothetical protein CRUP_002180 [Coryphaenoides rupestris]